MNVKKVLFVCTGNICRSPSAEGVFRDYVQSLSQDDLFIIDSAGTHGYHIGDPPDQRSINAAAKRNIDISQQQARRIETKDYFEFDHILAMDQGHFETLNTQMGSDCSAQLTLFSDYIENAQSPDIPDPYYDDLRTFEYVLDLLELGVIGLHKELTQNSDK